MLPAVSSTSRRSVYVSSPLGFTEFGRQALSVLYANLRQADLRVRDPWRWPGQRDPAAGIDTADLLWTARIAGEQHDWDVSQEIAARNVTELRAADAVLAVLDGADVDSGVAAEVGYASAIGKPVVGIRTDERGTTDSPGYVVNLQLTHLIARSCDSGGRIAQTVPEAIQALHALISALRG
jgi:nucleoside 2-deoxyribosyltransferase